MCLIHQIYSPNHIEKGYTMNKHGKKLKELSEILLKVEDDYGELMDTINSLYQLLYETSQFEANENTSKEDIYLPHGKAIGPYWAAACVKELMRTKYFLRGIYKGILEAKQRFPSQPLHIVYAGTGPFATLALPFTTLFSPEEISFTLLEINPRSIHFLSNIIDAFEIQPYISDVILCDASEYQLDKTKPIHMIISETMQNALQKEPQAAITLNLVPQMEEGGILIPQNIKVDAALMHPKKNMERMTSLGEYHDTYYFVLGTLLELNQKTKKSFPSIVLNIPHSLEPGFEELYLFTTLQIFEDVYLTPWQCSLTLPKKLMSLKQNENSVHQLTFQYVIDETPGFIYSASS